MSPETKRGSATMTNSRQRDTDKSKAHEAEFVLRDILCRTGTVEMFGTEIAIPDEKKFAQIADVQRYVDILLQMPAVQALNLFSDDVKPIRVRSRKGDYFAHYHRRGGGEIAVPPHEPGVGSSWAMREIVVLHEVAHHLTSGYQHVAAHGPEFRSVFAELLEIAIAPEARFLYQVACWDRGLDFAPRAT